MQEAAALHAADSLQVSDGTPSAGPTGALLATTNGAHERTLGAPVSFSAHARGGIPPSAFADESGAETPAPALSWLGPLHASTSGDEAAAAACASALSTAEKGPTAGSTPRSGSPAGTPRSGHHGAAHRRGSPYASRRFSGRDSWQDGLRAALSGEGGASLSGGESRGRHGSSAVGMPSCAPLATPAPAPARSPRPPP